MKLIDLLKEVVGSEQDLSQTKIVDDQGNPLVVYRSQAVASKDPARTQGERQSGHRGIYFSANEKSTKIYGPITKKYHLNIKNPLVIDDEKGDIWNLSVLPDYYYQMLIKKGYDGAVWIRRGEMYEIIAFYPEQIIPIES
jgi:hypothetical protein